MNVFVTGGTGFLGGTLVRELLARGDRVRALVRDPDKARRFLPPGAEAVRGDLDDVSAFAAHLAGVDVLIHTAAFFREYYAPGDHWPTMKRLNVDATVELLRAAERHGVGKAVVTSSSGVVGMKADGRPGDEDTPADARQLSNLYFRSKVEMDRAVADFARGSRLPVVTVLPGWMHGPGDTGPTGAGELILNLLARRLPAVVDGGTALVDVRDVALAMLRAAEVAPGGSRYAVAGRYVSFGELFLAVERASGVPVPRRTFPPRLLEAVAYVSERAAALRGEKATMSLDGIRTMHLKRSVDSSRAVRDLGATFRPLDETVRDAVAWFRAQGYDRPVKPSGTEARNQPA